MTSPDDRRTHLAPAANKIFEKNDPLDALAGDVVADRLWVSKSLKRTPVTTNIIAGQVVHLEEGVDIHAVRHRAEPGGLNSVIQALVEIGMIEGDLHLVEEPSDDHVVERTAAECLELLLGDKE